MTKNATIIFASAMKDPKLVHVVPVGKAVPLEKEVPLAAQVHPRLGVAAELQLRTTGVVDPPVVDPPVVFPPVVFPPVVDPPVVDPPVVDPPVVDPPVVDPPVVFVVLGRLADIPLLVELNIQTSITFDL